MKSKKARRSLDAINIQILRMLSNDISGMKISAELRIPKSTAFECICKLKRRGIVVKETVINWNKLGFRTTALVRISANTMQSKLALKFQKYPT